MDGPKPCAGEHSGDAFNDHWHIDRDPVAFGNAHRLKSICHCDNFVVQLRIGEGTALICRIIRLKDQRSLFAISRFDMAINRIVAKVELTILEPLDLGRIE